MAVGKAAEKTSILVPATRYWEFVNEQCSSGQRTRSNNRWRAILGLDQIISEQAAQRQAEIQQQLTEWGEKIQAERKSKMPAGNPTLPLERAGRGAAEPTAAEQCMFRGEPIAWLTVPTTLKQ